MCIIVCFFWLVACCFVGKVFWFSKEVSAVFGIRRLKSGLRTAKPSLSPYVQNIYGIEVKYIFLEVVHQGLSWEFFSDFSFFRYCTAPVENYWHWLLSVIVRENRAVSKDRGRPFTFIFSLHKSYPKRLTTMIDICRGRGSFSSRYHHIMILGSQAVENGRNFGQL